jgi:hypothetical protein
LHGTNITDVSIYATIRNAVMQVHVVATMAGGLVMIADGEDRYEEVVTQIGAANSLEQMQDVAAGISKAYHLANIAYHAVYLPGAQIFNPILVPPRYLVWVSA